MALFELTFHPGGRGLEIASSVVLNSAGSAEIDQANLRFVEGERDLRRERGERHAHDGVRRERLPPAVRHLQHAGGDERRRIDPRSIGRQQDLDVALRFVVDRRGPRSSAPARAAGDRREHRRRGDNRCLGRSARSRRHLACALERRVVPEHFHGDGGRRLAFRGRHRHFKDSRRAWQHVPARVLPS